jgi:predicted amino acid-binding ACT domain protein
MLDATDDASVESPTVVARRIVQRLDVGAAIEESVAQMVGDAELVQAASRRPDAFTEEAVLQLASHLRTTQQARSEFALARAGEDLDHETGNRLDELERLVLASLAQPQLTSRDAVNSLDLRRSQASSLTADQAVRERIECAPRAFALATDPEALAAGAALCEPPPGWDTVRLDVAEEPDATGCRRATVAARDRPGLLARVSGVFSRAGLEIVDATVGTWGDGCAVSSFRVRGPLVPAREPLERALRDALSEDLQTDPAPDVALAFDDTASPWHTVCTARARDRLGLLHLVTGAFAAAGVNVHAARLATVDDEVIDVFELTDAKGRKLDSATQQRVERLLASGVETRRRRWVPARTRA